MRMPVVLFDLDDTLCDTRGQRIRDLTKLFPDEPINPDYISPGCPPHMRKALRSIMSQPGWWENLPTLKDGFEIYELAKEVGLETQILSKAPETYPLAWTEKFLWCKRNVPGSKPTLTLEKFRYDGDILVDDWPSYVNTWLEENPKRRAILPLREWNRGYTHARAIHYTGKNIEQIAELFNALKTKSF